ncbi:PREDICTED: uncharacterized protein LOC106743037 [Dinoponera quadriceps]|uniref:Uncharacterized protein LOC106743037 n=1 Tax=Dinoponera quadriceps TaxID=609295 RepID=A0A6P3X2B8_DINQU|nr:PREDICTED: uncharacterized protein LOC106743037 [Dinoponera quadriceps]
MSEVVSPAKLGGTGDHGDVGEGDAGPTDEKKEMLPRYDFGKRWHRFRALTPRSFIIRGSRAMSDPRFKYRSRGRQAAPCSVVALVYGRIFSPKEWTQKHIDQVLEYGDKLFRLSMARNQVKADEYMRASLVHNEFYVSVYKVLIRIEDSGIRGNLFSESVGCSDLAEGLRKFLQSSDEAGGLITAQGNSAALWRQSPEAGFLYYDPASCDETGVRRPGGTACLMRFKYLDDLRDHLLKSVNPHYDSRYCIDRVTVLRVTEVGRPFVSPTVAGPVVQKSVLRSINPVDVDEHKRDCTKPVPKDEGLRGPARIRKEPLSITISNYSIDRRFATEPLVNRNDFDTGYSYDEMRVNVPSTFKELPGKAAILRGFTHEGSDKYKGKGAQNVANCVMSVVVKKVHPVKTWLRPKLDEILTLGDSVYADVKAEKPLIKTMTAVDLDNARVKVEDRKLVVNVDLISVTGTISSKAPSVLNLKQALEEFFLLYEDGVLETTSTAVAVWSQDDYYYMFDPRSCDAMGVRIKEEKAAKVEKGKKTDIEKKELQQGSCCVTRFPDVDSLVTLFFENIDPAKKNDRFTVRHVTIMDDRPGIRAWNEFQPGMAGKTWVLRGGISNVDESFEEENQGAQSLTMSVVALVNARETPPARWSSETVDEAVREGDAYYDWCKPAEAEVEEQMLLLQDLKKHFYLKNSKVKIDVEEAAVVGDLLAPDDSKVLNLKKGLRQFFDAKQYGIVETKNLSVAVWKAEEELKDKEPGKDKETFYYYFDPNPRDASGQAAEGNEENTACVVRALDVSTLAELIEMNAGREGGNDFAIHELKSVSVGAPMTDEEVEADKKIPIKPDLNNYSAMGDTGAVLLGAINQGNETLFKRQTRNKQQAANGLTTLAMTRLYNPHLWYREFVDDILKIGDRLATENLPNLLEAEAEEAVPRNYLLPSEITEDFDIGVNRMSIGLEEEVVSGRVTEMASLLEQFFKENAMGLLRQGETIMPVWREAEVFFTMDPRGRDARGEPVEKNGAAAVMWFTDLPSLAAAIQAVTRDDNFVIDAVTMENVYETRTAEARRMKRTTSGEDLWHHFPKLEDGVWNINGTVTMTNERFGEANRGKQSAAVAAMAIIFSKVYQPKYWTSNILDEVVITGDKLHSKCVERLGAGSVPLVNEMISEFFLSTRRIALTIKDCVQAGNLTGRSPKVQDLRSGIDNFFEKHDAGALTVRRDRNLAIWKANDAYYALVPDWSTITVEETTSMAPRLFRFRNASLLVEYLLRHFGEEGDYQITAIDVLDWDKLPPWKFDPSPGIRPTNLPPLNAYKRLQGEARAILRGTYHQGGDIFPETLRNRQTAANCVVALGMSVIKSPVTWTKKTMDEILAIGSGVHLETKKARPTKSRLKPKDIIRVFYVGVNVLTADVEPNIVTGQVAIAPVLEETKEKKPGERKKAPPKKGEKAVKDKKEVKRERTPPPPSILLEEGLRTFFQNNRAGILVTDRGMIAIWKDLGVYFMYDSRARSDQGLPDADGTSCVMWFACMEPLYDIIFANVNQREKYGPFEICRVIIKTTMIEPLPCPAGFRPCIDSIAPVISAKKTPNVEPLSEYVIVDEELGVLLGTLHMNHHVYSPKSRGLQSTAIAAVAIVVGLLHVPSTWTAELIDAVLKYGDQLHSDSARVARPGARNLSPSELLTVFIVGDFRVTVHVHNHTAAGILHVYDLSEAMSMFFRTNCAGILHTTNIAVAVMQHYGKFYMFDPSSRSDRGGPAAVNGAACVMKCDSIARMAELFVSNCNLRKPSVYTLNAVNVLSLHFFSDTRTVCPPK